MLVTLIEKRREVQKVADQLRQFPKGILMDLADGNAETGEALRERCLL